MKGLNFAVTPKHLPVVDIVTVTESACRSLNNDDASDLRAKVASVIDKNKVIKEHNITKEERNAVEDLRKDGYYQQTKEESLSYWIRRNITGNVSIFSRMRKHTSTSKVIPLPSIRET
jgi:hypothetical protein